MPVLPARQLVNAALDLVFPSRCVACGAAGSLFCARCSTDSPKLDGPACRYCALPLGSGDTCTRCRIITPPLDRLIAAYQFDGAVRHAVHALKYRDLRALGPLLGRIMAALPQVARLEIDTVVPVPLHWRRLRTRGYNHAGLLADEIGLVLALPVQEDLLKRERNTPPQARASDEGERTRQVAGAFAADKAAAGKRVLLVDDVATTCSTLNACASALKSAGAARVCGLVLARDI